MASGADVTTLAATVDVGLNSNVAMSLRSACHVAHKRTIAAGVILNPLSAPIASTMVRKRVDQILAPGRGIAHARRSLREQARDGQGGGSAANRGQGAKARRPHLQRQALPTWDAPYRGSSPVGRMRRIDKRSGRR